MTDLSKLATKFIATIKKIYYISENMNTSFGLKTDILNVEVGEDGLITSFGNLRNELLIDSDVYVEGNWTIKNDIPVFQCYKILLYTETLDFSKKLLKTLAKRLKERDDTLQLTEPNIKKILKISGIDIIEFVKRPDALNLLKKEFKKTDERKLETLYDELKKLNISDGIMEYLTPYGGDAVMASKLLNSYGANAVYQLKTHPYAVGEKLNFDFFICDRIAKDNHFKCFKKERLEYIIKYSVRTLIENSGSTYVTKSELLQKINSVSNKSSFPDFKITNAVILSTITKIKGIFVEDYQNTIRIFDSKLYHYEKDISFNLKRLNVCKEIDFDENLIYETEKELKIKYGKEQFEALQVLKSKGIKIITGGPGTGKTTIINGILHMYKKIFPSNIITLAAPTGRAAQRMSEITGMEALTIHKLLNFVPFDNGTIKHMDRNDRLTTNLVIIDEMSMVGTEIFSFLLDAVPNNTLMILIGDENQLESVDPGNILHDLIKSGEFETHRLKEVFRQKGNNTIIDNAYLVLNGKSGLLKDTQFEILSYKNDKNLLDDVIKTFDKFDKNIQILIPTKKNLLGTISINDILANHIQTKEKKESDFFESKGTKYHVGDKVIFTKNQYDKGYYNGDIGYVFQILKNGFSVIMFDKTIIDITGQFLQDVILAYAITIHKSQGSEAENVLIVLPRTYAGLLNRNMLYTGITRAKKYIKILYVDTTIYDCISNINSNQRKTGLIDKINKWR